MENLGKVAVVDRLLKAKVHEKEGMKLGRYQTLDGVTNSYT